MLRQRFVSGADCTRRSELPKHIRQAILTLVELGRENKSAKECQFVPNVHGAVLSVPTYLEHVWAEGVQHRLLERFLEACWRVCPLVEAAVPGDSAKQ